LVSRRESLVVGIPGRCLERFGRGELCRVSLAEVVWHFVCLLVMWSHSALRFAYLHFGLPFRSSSEELSRVDTLTSSPTRGIAVPKLCRGASSSRHRHELASKESFPGELARRFLIPGSLLIRLWMPSVGFVLYRGDCETFGLLTRIAKCLDIAQNLVCGHLAYGNQRVWACAAP
jgi:hypothetical protein